MAKLITGGTGFVGAELAHILVGRGEDVVIFDRTIKRYRIQDIESKLKLVQGDLGDLPEVLNVVKDNKITHIYHVGATLLYASQANPWSAFRSNVVGTQNVLEAARLFGVERVMFASTMGTFNQGVGAELTDTTIQRPVHFYGLSKLWGEGLGRFYRTRFGLDFRGVRYPGVTGPGRKATDHWWIPMIEGAVKNKRGECRVSEDSRFPMVFVKDAARAADMILQAPKETIKTVNYNVSSDPNFITAKQVEQAIKKHIPGTVITYKPDPAVMEPLKSRAHVRVFDDSCARKEWDWQPAYPTIDDIVGAYIEDMKAHPEYNELP